MQIETVADLDSLKRAIIAHFHTSIQALVYCGEKLKIARASLGNETSFKGFCQSLPFSLRSAYHYIRLHEHEQVHGLDFILASKIDATTWYTLPVDSDKSKAVLESAKKGKSIPPVASRVIVQELHTSEPTAHALETLAEHNPKLFVDIVERRAVTDPVTGDDVSLAQADATLIHYASNTDESERIKRQRQYISDSQQSRFTNTVSFRVNTQPLPKQRARTGKFGAYTPQRTRDYETRVGWAAKAAMGQISPFTGDCSLSITFYREGKRRADLSNMIKAIEDGMNGIAYTDDAQVIEYGYMRVIYEADNPGAEVTVSELKENILTRAA